MYSWKRWHLLHPGVHRKGEQEGEFSGDTGFEYRFRLDADRVGGRGSMGLHGGTGKVQPLGNP